MHTGNKNPHTSEFDSPKGEHLCKRCSELGPTCCASSPETCYLSFPLSLAEWQRLLPFIDKAVPCDIEDAEIKGPPGPEGNEPVPGDAVRKAEKNCREFMRSMRAIFPGESSALSQIFPENGTHWRLRTTEAGSCVFLGAEGCIVPREARPWYCRIYPAWISHGELTFFLSESCLMSQKAKTPEQGLDLLGLSDDEVINLYTMLRTDWGLP